MRIMQLALQEPSQREYDTCVLGDLGVLWPDRFFRLFRFGPSLLHEFDRARQVGE